MHMKISPAVEEKLRAVTMVVMDVDGVLTDGGIYLTAQGDEVKRFDVKDGTGIKYLHRAGLKTAIITGRTSEAVSRRAIELGIDDVHQGALVKKDALEKIIARHSLDPSDICAIGDDLPDLPILRRVGVGVAVADARPEVLEAADFVTRAPGGHGAMRELVEVILRAQGKWDSILSRYR